MSTIQVPPGRPLLRMRGIEKSFPGVKALRGTELSVDTGEVVALLGENGAGKSTLIKILGGAHLPDAGTIELGGEAVRIDSPTASQRAGIGIIYQEFNLVPELSAWENIFLGCERTRWGFVRRGEERRLAQELFERIGAKVPVDTPCGRLSTAQQQLVEIAKALSRNVRLIVMDEPTAALTPAEVDRLLDIVRELRSRGIGVVYVSHRLDEIFRIADRVTVMRDGAYVGTEPIGTLSRSRMIEMMVGRTIDDEFPKERRPPGPTRLKITGLTRGTAVRNVSFEVRRGEVLGITGLVGAGRTETARLIFGADRADSGTIELDGRTLSVRNPRDAIREGICLLTEDRKTQGLVLGLGVRENFGLPNLEKFTSGGIIQGARERAAFAGHVERLRIKIPHQDQLARNLSGGNQQKVILAKWLERNAEVLIFDEPTRGIDVGTKYDIYQLMNELARQGKAIVMISSELPEVLGMSDRILVMHAGRVTGTIDDAASATQERIMDFAVG